MGGGHFEYQHHRMGDIVYELKYQITNNNTEESEHDERGHFYSEKTIFRFKSLVKKLQKAYDLTHAVDLLLSGDSSEESFNEAWDAIIEPDSVCLNVEED